MEFVLFLVVILIYSCGNFEIIHWIYCKKNKGNCYKCNDWSCCRQHYLDDHNIKVKK